MTDSTRKPIGPALTGISICIVLGVLVMLAGSDGGLTTGALPVFAICGMVGFVLHWLVFVPSYIYQTEHYFDLTGALSFIGATVLANYLIMDAQGALDTRGLLLSGMVLAWALRLGSFLFLRVRRSGQDRRFNEIKTRFWRFLFTWTLGGLWVLITMAAALAAMSSGRNVPMGWLSWLGAALWLAGFFLEVFADRQKSAFRAEPRNQDRFIQSGVWAWSRHPNYFGEMVLWAGVALVAVPALQGWQWLTLLSPVFVVFLLCRVSGIPLLEARAEEKWGNDPEYIAYKQATPVLIPALKRAGKRE